MVSLVWSPAHLLGHLQAWQPLSTVRENSNYAIIRAETGTYKAADPEGASRRISVEKRKQRLCCRVSCPPITMKQDKQPLDLAIRAVGRAARGLLVLTVRQLMKVIKKCTRYVTAINVIPCKRESGSLYVWLPTVLHALWLLIQRRKMSS